MKTIILVLVILLTAVTVALGAPFLVCDYQAGVDQYQVDGLPSSMSGTQTIPAHNATYGFKYDLATLPPGTYTVKARACKTDALWGGACSANSNPLSFTRPSVPSGVVSLKVTK